MTADQVIHEIEALPREEQARVIRFACRLDAQRRRTGPELASLADHLVRSTDPAEALRLREEIARGFYGGKPEAESPPPQSPARSAQSSAGPPSATQPHRESTGLAG